jgi:hypothetical protein
MLDSLTIKIKKLGGMYLPFFPKDIENFLDKVLE